jgi:NADPH:quinone reductase-like Zn-dependent oxidoreductase
MTLSLFTGKGAKFVGCHRKKADLEQLGSSWLEEGLNVEIDSIFPIKDVSQAVKHQRDRNKIGSVVIKVEKGWN